MKIANHSNFIHYQAQQYNFIRHFLRKKFYQLTEEIQQLMSIIFHELLDLLKAHLQSKPIEEHYIIL